MSAKPSACPLGGSCASRRRLEERAVARAASRSGGRGGRARAPRAAPRPRRARRASRRPRTGASSCAPALTCEIDDRAARAAVEADEHVREVLGRHLRVDALDVAGRPRTSRPAPIGRAPDRDAWSRGRRSSSRHALAGHELRRGRASASRCRRPRAARRPCRARAASSSRSAAAASPGGSRRGRSRRSPTRRPRRSARACWHCG